MPIKKSFIEQDVLRPRRRLTWLGWLTIVVTASFLLTLGLAAWHFSTNQLSSLTMPTFTTPQSPKTSELTFVHVTTTQLPISSLATVTAPAARAESWTVFKSRDVIGQEIWDGAPEIKAQVVQDYLDAMAWTDAHMFALDVLDAQLDRYYTDKRVSEMRAILQWEKRNKRVIAISRVKRLPLGTFVSTFSQDGKSATVIDYHAAGRGQVFDLETRKPLQGNAYPNSMHMVELKYDDAAKRWKIAHEKMIFDLDASQVLWQEEWDRAE
mgnify:CR=1 FL=1